ncbi:hypothetical protein TrST_g12056 [Triparma strigata]|uniref:DWNN domain-containing protein n=1 Tax=Triparma strigata TaxID=1606541 RepID=A0A9W7AHC8_9STRA|nr:hypothetical protein TrST_g12056 [Triparma strigata]
MSGLLSHSTTTIYYRYPPTSSPSPLTFPIPMMIPLWDFVKKVVEVERLGIGLDFLLSVRNGSTGELYTSNSQIPSMTVVEVKKESCGSVVGVLERLRAEGVLGREEEGDEDEVIDRDEGDVKRFNDSDSDTDSDQEALSKLLNQASSTRHGSSTLGSKVGRRMNVKRNTVGVAYKPKQHDATRKDVEEDEIENKGTRGMPMSFLQSITATTKSGNVIAKTVVQSNLMLGKDDKSLQDMLDDLGFKIMDNVLCPLCLRVLENPVNLPWDEGMRSVCLDCIVSRCNDFNGFRCPLTGVEEVNVGVLKGSERERDRVKNYVESIKSQWKSWRHSQTDLRKRKRLSEMRDLMIEDEEDYEEENEFEDMKKVESDDEFGGDVYGQVESDDLAVEKPVLIRKNEEEKKNDATPQINVDKQPSSISLTTLPISGPQNATYQLLSLSSDPVNLLPSGYAIGPGGMVGRDTLGYYNNTGVGGANVSGEVFRPIMPLGGRGGRGGNQMQMQQGQMQQMQQGQMQQGQMQQQQFGGRGGMMMQQQQFGGRGGRGPPRGPPRGFNPNMGRGRGGRGGRGRGGRG